MIEKKKVIPLQVFRLTGGSWETGAVCGESVGNGSVWVDTKTLAKLNSPGTSAGCIWGSASPCSRYVRLHARRRWMPSECRSLNADLSQNKKNRNKQQCAEMRVSPWIRRRGKRTPAGCMWLCVLPILHRISPCIGGDSRFWRKGRGRRFLKIMWTFSTLVAEQSEVLSDPHFISV